MAKPGQAHAEFLAKLVAESCLPILQGKLPAKMPVEAVPLTDDEKARVRAAPQALVVFYPVEDTGVFLQLGSSRAVAWYDGVPSDNALATLERAFKEVKPRITFIEEKPFTEAAGTSVRIYRLDIAQGRYADLEVMYPSSKKARQQFMVRMTAWEMGQ